MAHMVDTIVHLQGSTATLSIRSMPSPASSVKARTWAPEVTLKGGDAQRLQVSLICPGSSTSTAAPSIVTCKGVERGE